MKAIAKSARIHPAAKKKFVGGKNLPYKIYRAASTDFSMRLDSPFMGYGPVITISLFEAFRPLKFDAKASKVSKSPSPAI